MTINLSRAGQFRALACLAGYFLVGCGTTADRPTHNDFSTLARIEYVLDCMNQNGGQSYQTLYPCVCSMDKLAALMTYDEYVEALTYDRLGSVSGERGAIFRDPPRAKELGRRLKNARSTAANECGQIP